MRIEGRGHIDRSDKRAFTFNGTRYEGFRGDTLASALLANGVQLVGRSFKYHRPRGILTAGSEEPNALVTLGHGASQSPNERATMAEVFDGLQARSQNHVGSLKHDFMAFNDLFSPFLGAGFYYKTFMWPKSFWERIYEPLIRRAAGLGALSGDAADEPYDKAFAHCDLLIIGAGPAGLMAALVAAKSGADVILADEDFLPGGRLNAETGEVGGKPGADWAVATIATLSAMDNVRIMTRTTMTGAYDGGTFGALERVSEHLSDPDPTLPRQTFWRIAARRAILAAGATERPVAFPMNDRPGVMMAGAMGTYLNRFGVAAGARVAIFANNDAAHGVARDYLDAGLDVLLIDARPDAEPGADCETLTGAQVISTRGRHGVEEITIRTPGGTRRERVQALGMSGGWNPNVHLTCHMNGRPTWDEGIQAFIPTPGSVPGLSAAGAAAGVFSTHGCLKSGAEAARAALKDLGLKPATVRVPAASDQAGGITPLWQVEAKGRAWLDFQNDVTTKDIAQSVSENFRSVEHMKRYTTQGMATDQGKNSNINALAVMADLTGQPIPEVGTTTYRPPYVPVALAALGAHGAGKGFAPERFMTSHRASEQRHAPFIEAGLWYRPSWFPAPGETHWRQSCDREVGLVRDAVGVCDVSTLGKIDIQGPDAGEFLDRVYTNMFSTLKVGKVRYGLMLREDGHVMDDGTSARLGETHYLMTTTTAGAGHVMAHLEFCQQVLWPEMDVHAISVTDQWAQFAVAGPRARQLLEGIVAEDISDEVLPFMGVRDVTVCGVAGRLFRISFSGELGYEIAVPARYGDALFRTLVMRAEALDGGAYGMEALNVLRIEKGFITHAEIDGRVTAFDIGLERMISAKKDCIGKTMAARPGLVGEAREQMVGIKPAGAVGQLTAGARFYLPGEPTDRVHDHGYVTSVCYSPTLGHMIGLGFLKNGRARIGEKLRLIDRMRRVEAMVEICDPVFLDQSGGRARG